MRTEYDPLPYREVYFPVSKGYNHTEGKTMPCGGPDLEQARKEGEKIGKELFRQLVKEFKLTDLADPDYPIGRYGTGPKAVERWTAAKAKFIEAMGDLWVEEWSNSW